MESNEIKLYTVLFTLKSDNGLVRLKTTAFSLEAARDTILKIELAPLRAIIKEEIIKIQTIA